MAYDTISELKIGDTTYDLLDANTLSAVSALKQRVIALETATSNTSPGSSDSGQDFRWSSGVDTSSATLRLIRLGKIRALHGFHIAFTSNVSLNASRNICVLPTADCPVAISYAMAILSDAYIGKPYVLANTSNSRLVTFENKSMSVDFPKGQEVAFSLM